MLGRALRVIHIRIPGLQVLQPVHFLVELAVGHRGLVQNVVFVVLFLQFLAQCAYLVALRRFYFAEQVCHLPDDKFVRTDGSFVVEMQHVYAGRKRKHLL